MIYQSQQQLGKTQLRDSTPSSVTMMDAVEFAWRKFRGEQADEGLKRRGESGRRGFFA
jgi:hypothetical protein